MRSNLSSFMQITLQYFYIDTYVKYINNISIFIYGKRKQSERYFFIIYLYTRENEIVSCFTKRPLGIHYKRLEQLKIKLTK